MANKSTTSTKDSEVKAASNNKNNTTTIIVPSPPTSLPSTNPQQQLQSITRSRKDETNGLGKTSRTKSLTYPTNQKNNNKVRNNETNHKSI